MPFALSITSTVPSKTTFNAFHCKSRDSGGCGLANEVSAGCSLLMMSSNPSPLSSRSNSMVNTAREREGGGREGGREGEREGGRDKVKRERGREGGQGEEREREGRDMANTAI